MANRGGGAGLALVAAIGAGCVGNIGSGNERPAGPGSEPEVIPFAPAEPTVHRLTAVQLHNSYLVLFDEPLILPQSLPPDDLLYGFTSISSAASTIAPLDAEKYETAAYAVIDQVWADPLRRAFLIGCVPETSDDPCIRGYFEEFGRRAWRRPLSEAEVDALVALSQKVALSLQDTHEGLRYGTAAVLQSPYFLFRIELGEPMAVGDPKEGMLRFSSWEMASRLSYLLTDSPPDDELLADADSGALDDVAVVKAHAERLLDDPRARPALTRFFRDFMNIGRLDQLDKSPDLFPQLSAALGPAMRLQIEKMFEAQVFDRERDFRELFTTREAFMNEDLAKVYDLDYTEPPDRSPGVSELLPYLLPDDGKRAGLLTTPGFLALNAHKTVTSPTHRGRFVRLNLLCQDVPPPPAGVDTTLPDPDPGKPTTLRERLEEHRDNPACASCHNQMDPIGFALEHYDAIGAWRDDENGLPINDTTDLDGEPLEGGIELGVLIGAMPEVSSCIARRFYQHATGHLDEKGDSQAVDALIQSFVAGNYDFKGLVAEMVVNDGYRYVSPVEIEEEP